MKDPELKIKDLGLKKEPQLQIKGLSLKLRALVMGNVAISSCLARRLPAKPYYHPLIRGYGGRQR